MENNETYNYLPIPTPAFIPVDILYICSLSAFLIKI